MQIFAAGKSGSKQGGFTYLIALIAVAVVSVFAGIASQYLARQVQSEREAELLFRGIAYQRAIRSYYLAGNPNSYPVNLESLLRDPRFAHRQHLRSLYDDPFSDEWLLIRVPGGGISGLASSSTAAPIKQVYFPVGLESFEHAESYRNWRFEVTNHLPLQHSLEQQR